MQLHFTRDELALVAQILELQSSSGNESTRRASYSLLDRVIAHDLRFGSDELEDLQDILVAYDHTLRSTLAAAPKGQKSSLCEKEKLLEKIMDKVTEACAMV